MSEATPVKKPAGRARYELDDRLKAYKGIWVLVEHEQGEVHPVSWELMGEARKLADMFAANFAQYLPFIDDGVKAVAIG